MRQGGGAAGHVKRTAFSILYADKIFFEWFCIVSFSPWLSSRSRWLASPAPLPALLCIFPQGSACVLPLSTPPLSTEVPMGAGEVCKQRPVLSRKAFHWLYWRLTGSVHWLSNFSGAV